MIKIVYACNDGYKDCLGLSIISILRRTKQTIHFYLLTADFTQFNPKYTALTDEHEQFFKKIVKSFNSENDFTKIDCQELYKVYLKNTKNHNLRCSPYSSLRLLIDKTNLDGKIIYLDTDIMVCGDISELANIDTKDYAFGANRDYWLRFFKPRKYFNAGVLVINLDIVRQKNIFEKCCELLINKNMHLADQTALYKVGKKAKCHFIFPNKFKFNTQGKINSDTLIKHFNAGWVFPHGWQNIKQNDIEKVHNWLKIHTFDEDYAEWEKIKKEMN